MPVVLSQLKTIGDHFRSISFNAKAFSLLKAFDITNWRKDL